MPENIKLYDRDYTEVLLETENREVAALFLRDSGKSWLPMTIAYGSKWTQRWSGRLEMPLDGVFEASNHFHFLKFMYVWPDIPIAT